MASEREQEIRDFVREDGNESFQPQLERICPHCRVDRKTLALACVSDWPEDRAAAWSITESCPQCKEAMVDVMGELERRHALREQRHCPECGSPLIEKTWLGPPCLVRGGIDYPGSVPYVREDHSHCYSRLQSHLALVA